MTIAATSSLPGRGARLRWLSTARLPVIVGAAVLATLVDRVFGGLALAPLLLTLAALAALSIGTIYFVDRRGAAGLSLGEKWWLAAAQVVADIVALTLVIHFSGGAENPFFPLYAIPVIVAAVLPGRVPALGAATLASLLYAGVVLAEWSGALPHHDALPGASAAVESAGYAIAQSVAVAVTVFVAAEGTSMLVGALKTRARDLEANQHRTEERTAEMRRLNEQLRTANEELSHQRGHLDAAYAELMIAHERLQVRSSHMSELNEQLRLANAECKSRREELAQVNEKLREALGRLETRTEHMSELNELLREANGECRARRDELERLNAELALANRKLRELEDVRAQFTLLTTHELRAPVAAIQSYLKLILEGYVPQAKVRETLEKAERRAMEQLALIADLLELGRIGSADARGLVQPTQIEQSLAEQVEFLSGNARERGITIETRVGSSLSPVLANPDQIKSLWNNLISNAIKYNRDGGQVDVTLIEEGGRLIATVQDTGIGIPAEAMTRLFSEFFRADNAKAQSRQGTGLGLSIVKEIVERAGGQITVESELGVGTRFYFWLPVHAPVAPRAPAAPQTSAQAA